MTYPTTTTGRRLHRPGRLAARIARLPQTVFRLILLSRQRQALRDLEMHRLCDMGITPGQARDEAARRFWDAPAHWRL